MNIKPQYGLEVGISRGGYLRIAQTVPDTEECVLLLSANEVRLLIEVLQAHADGDWWSSFEKDESDD